MVHYTLYYFPLRGRAEPIRQLFVYAGVSYEEKAIPLDEWPKFKETLPFGQMPMLEVDGKQLTQSLAIFRYLAKKFGLAGDGDWEAARCDMLAEGMNDLIGKLNVLAFIGALQSGDKEKLNAELNRVKSEVLPKFLKLYEGFLKENGTGWFVGDKVTWVDFMVADWMDKLDQLDPTILRDYPLMKAHLEKVHGIPQIKQRIELIRKKYVF